MLPWSHSSEYCNRALAVALDHALYVLCPHTYGHAITSFMYVYVCAERSIQMWRLKHTTMTSLQCRTSHTSCSASGQLVPQTSCYGHEIHSVLLLQSWSLQRGATSGLGT